MKKFLEKATQYALQISDIERLYNMELTLLKDEKDLTDPEHTAFLRTQLKIENKYGRVIDTATVSKRTSALCELEGFLIGPGQYRDKKHEMKDFVAKYIKDNGKRAAENAGYVDGTGVLLDYRSSVFGRDNPHLNDPLESVDIPCEMSLNGIFRRVGEDTFVYSRFSTTNSAVAESWYKSLKFPDHNFIPVKTWGNVKETVEGFSVGASIAEETKTVFKKETEPTYKVHDAFIQAIGHMVCEIDMLADHVIKHGNEYNRIVFIRGVIDSVRPEWANRKGTPAYLCDEQDVVNRIKIWLPEGYEKQFGSGTTAIVYGKDREIMGQAEDGKWNLPTGRYEVQCIGVYPLPGLKVSTLDAKTKIAKFNAFV